MVSTYTSGGNSNPWSEYIHIYNITLSFNYIDKKYAVLDNIIMNKLINTTSY